MIGVSREFQDAILAGTSKPNARVGIDLNVRTHGNQTFTCLTSVQGDIVKGQPVEVFEEESGIHGDGVVTRIDHVKGLVYLYVDWAGLREPQ